MRKEMRCLFLPIMISGLLEGGGGGEGGAPPLHPSIFYFPPLSIEHSRRHRAEPGSSTHKQNRFTLSSMDEISAGLVICVDSSTHKQNRFTLSSMDEISAGLFNRVDSSTHKQNRFTLSSMDEISEGLLKRVDCAVMSSQIEIEKSSAKLEPMSICSAVQVA